MNSSPLIDRVRDLSAKRSDALRVAAELKVRREAFDRENEALIRLAKEAAFIAHESETALRAVVLELYEKNGDRRPAPGVEVKLFKDYTINEEQGLEWAKQKDICLIPARLDVDAIKKLASVTPLPFVLVEELPKVQIATDLEKALAVQQLWEVGTETVNAG